MEANQRAFLNVYRHCGVIAHALRAARLNHDAHLYWMEHDPTYPARFAKARTQWGDALRDRAHALAVDGAAEMVLHNGRPVIVEGKKLYRVKYDTALIMRLLAAYDRETYGETKVIQIDLKDWDGDISKLNEKSVKGILALLETELKRQEAEEAREAGRQPVKALSAAMKQELVEQITAEPEDRPLN
jgi:hypothetical protein